MNQPNEQGMAICQECGKPFKSITPKHLVKIHNMSMEEYKNKYPGTKLVSDETMARHKMRRVQIFKEEEKHEVLVEENKEFNMDKIPPIPKNIKEEVMSFIDEVKTLTDNMETPTKEYPNPTNSIHRDKIKILNFLLTFFPDVQNSFFIEKKSISGSLQYRLITDICIPSHMINLEFPKSFWHNYDVPKSNRDKTLKSDGWMVIDVLSSKPSIKEIKNILQEKKIL